MEEAWIRWRYYETITSPVLKRKMDEHLVELLQQRYQTKIQHNCEKNPNNKMIVLDGNFKLYRKICGNKNVFDIYQGKSLFIYKQKTVFYKIPF